jgi:hypothetical protein
MRRATPSIATAVAALGAVLTAVAMVHEGSPGDLSWWVGAVPFAVWTLSPFVLVMVLWAPLGRSRPARGLLAAASVVATGLAAYLLFMCMHERKSSTFGLVFLFFPAFQLLLVAPLSFAAWFAGRAER